MEGRPRSYHARFAGECALETISRKLLISFNSLRWFLRRDARTGALRRDHAATVKAYVTVLSGTRGSSLIPLNSLFADVLCELGKFQAVELIERKGAE
jgi:hypothetical protein